MYIAIQSEENKKALIYTTTICTILIILFILIRWNTNPPPEIVIQDQIEINLGNEEEGFGQEQPLKKGSPTPEFEKSTPIPTSSDDNSNVAPDDNAEDNAAVITKTEKKTANSDLSKVTTPATTNNNKAKYRYQGPNTGNNGNNADVDNGFTSQGNNPTGAGDVGSSNGNPEIIEITKTMLKNIKVEDDELGTAIIYAKIKVSTSGVGEFIKFEKKSSDRKEKYKEAIIKWLPKIPFNARSQPYEVVAIFNFKEY
jgi:hypothetical protein